jgi:hypothetical protein
LGFCSRGEVNCAIDAEGSTDTTDPNRCEHDDGEDPVDEHPRWTVVVFVDEPTLRAFYLPIF